MADPIRILIVDDNASVRVMLSRMLSRRSGFQVVSEAESGEQACEAAMDAEPDVVLMDVFMAGMSGVEAARTISEKLPNVCIIGVSATEDGPIHEAMREAGAVDFVPKTASVDQLVMAIQAAATVRRRSLAQSQA
ncbi:MAG TPA: response regulator transcription factor [Pirellulaceae bacterium]|jgi:two-component system invasion response regulator UvrY|nr:response regulator transcription factor [Pirellulaceae bacterium]